MTEKAPKKVTIYLRGASYNGSNGDRRVVDEETAENLVRAGLARRAKEAPAS